MAAIQDIQLRILTAFQASDQPRTQDRAQRGPGAARGCSHGAPRPRKCHLPTLEPGELRVWGLHLIAPHGWQTTGQVRAQVPSVLGPLWPWGSPRGHADQGSNGTGRTRPGGDAKGEAATRPSGTIPPSTTAGGSAWGADSTTCVFVTSARSGVRGRQLARRLFRPSPMPWLEAPPREGRSTPLRSIRLDLAQGPREPGSLATSSSWTPMCRGRLVRPPLRPRSRFPPPNPRTPLHTMRPGQPGRPRAAPTASPERILGTRIRALRGSNTGRAVTTSADGTGGPGTSEPFWDWGPAQQRPQAASLT